MAVGGAWVDLSSVDSANERDYRQLLRLSWFQAQPSNWDSLRLSRRKRVAITGPWCPLDALGCTRATMLGSIGIFLCSANLKGWATPIIPNVVGIDVCNQRHEPGIPCKCVSTSHVEYVPALCTHRPSLLPIGWFGEVAGAFGQRHLSHII